MMDYVCRNAVLKKNMLQINGILGPVFGLSVNGGGGMDFVSGALFCY